jgi:hypothetical protein
MKINSYNKQQYINNKEQTDIANKNKLNKKEEKNNMNTHINSTDSIEISENSKQLNSIRNKIEGGFYDNPSILRKVAEKILHTIDSKT